MTFYLIPETSSRSYFKVRKKVLLFSGHFQRKFRTNGICAALLHSSLNLRNNVSRNASARLPFSTFLRGSWSWLPQQASPKRSNVQLMLLLPLRYKDVLHIWYSPVPFQWFELAVFLWKPLRDCIYASLDDAPVLSTLTWVYFQVSTLYPMAICRAILHYMNAQQKTNGSWAFAPSPVEIVGAKSGLEKLNENFQPPQKWPQGVGCYWRASLPPRADICLLSH